MCTYNLGWSLLGISAVHYRHDTLGEAQESLTGDGIHLGSSRRTIITTLADALNDRNLGKQWHVHLLGEILATLLTEDIILVLRQLGRSKVSHVLDKTEDRYIHFIILIHVNTLSCIGKRHLLRSTYDHRTRDGECLEQGKMNVTGARRSIKDEVIQLTPVSIGNQLFQGRASHTATPQGSRGRTYEETDTQELHAIFLDRFDEARLRAGLPDDKKIILFVSQKVTDERKGMSFFVEAIDKLVAQHPAFRNTR